MSKKFSFLTPIFNWTLQLEFALRLFSLASKIGNMIFFNWALEL